MLSRPLSTPENRGTERVSSQSRAVDIGVLRAIISDFMTASPEKPELWNHALGFQSFVTYRLLDLGKILNSLPRRPS